MLSMIENELYRNLSFPLPYRVLFLTGFGILGWATNLHGLDLCGIDVFGTMGLRTETNPINSALPVYRYPALNNPKPASIYLAAYRLFFSYSGFCIVSWALFRAVTRGDPTLVDNYGHIPLITAIAIIFLLLSPFNILEKSERDKFVNAIRRCLFPGPVCFADVILADIGTSFAKVFGDAWHCICMLKPGNSILSVPVQDHWLRWILPTMMSIPFFLRFRQCIVEFNSPGNDSRKPLYNALKYATSFPVIFLSAAQRYVVVDVVKEQGQGAESRGEEHPLFRLWLLAAIVNSLYSFWWDVTNDWGLELLRLEPDRQLLRPPPPASFLILDDDSNPSIENSHHVPQTNLSIKHRYRRSCRGLRPVLSYPRAVYPLLIFLNLLLRMTWSVKLSTHVQLSWDGSFAFFWLEVAELVRRWLWVFIRVEWEAVKAGEAKGSVSLLDDDVEYEMIPESDSGFRTS